MKFTGHRCLKASKLQLESVSGFCAEGLCVSQWQAMYNSPMMLGIFAPGLQMDEGKKGRMLQLYQHINLFHPSSEY